MMRVWITTVGKSPFAVVNPIWMVCRTGEFIPERVYLIWNEAVEEERDIVKDLTEVILKSYGISEPEIIADESVKVREEDFQRFMNLLIAIRDKELHEGNEVAIDMTPGRKFMSALSMGLGFSSKHIHRVYYLHLSDQRYTNVPLILIPFKLQKLYEMRRELCATSEE